MLSNFINNPEIYYSFLKDKLDEKFIDKLNSIQDNHLDDMDVTKEISNILCKVCLKSESLASHISICLYYLVNNGGLSKVIEELKSLIKSNDNVSKSLKLNGLKFIHSICKNDNYLNKFIDCGGIELIQDMIKYELKHFGDFDDKQINNKNQYITNETYYLTPYESIEKNINDFKVTEDCFKIINKVIKRKDDVKLDPELFSNMVKIIEYI